MVRRASASFSMAVGDIEWVFPSGFSAGKAQVRSVSAALIRRNDRPAFSGPLDYLALLDGSLLSSLWRFREDFYP
ncbi:hypothetical protein WM25_24745 [Burkholderia ubonensis]|nr:hypothetical protein WM25_24745 [Burkholderia ubonensis]